MDDAVEHPRRVVEPVEALPQDKSRGKDTAEIYSAAVARRRGEPGPATATGRCAQTHRETRRASPAMLHARGARHGPRDRKSANRIAAHTWGCAGPCSLRDLPQLCRRAGRLERVPVGPAGPGAVPPRGKPWRSERPETRGDVRSRRAGSHSFPGSNAAQRSPGAAVGYVWGWPLVSMCY